MPEGCGGAEGTERERDGRAGGRDRGIRGDRYGGGTGGGRIGRGRETEGRGGGRGGEGAGRAEGEEQVKTALSSVVLRTLPPNRAGVRSLWS